MEFTVAIENLSTGAQVGAGPVYSAQSWQQTAILNGSGSGSFAMPATDSRAALVTPRRLARARTLLGGAMHDFGALIIDSIGTSEDFQGGGELSVQGNDLFDELACRIVPALSLETAGAPTTDPFTALLGYASGWSMDAVNGYTTTNAPGVLLTLADETVLAALVKIAELTGESFRLGVGRKIVWLRDLTAAAVSADVRLINGGSGYELSGNDDVAIITDLSVESNTHELLTYVYPRGAGDGAARLSLAATTRFAAPGNTPGDYTSGDYTLHIDADPLESYIKAVSAATTYGQIERPMTYSEITPLTSDAADTLAAANQLFDAALSELKRRSQPAVTYSIACTKLEKQVLAGQTVFVSYRGMAGDYLYVDIEDDFLVLAVTTELDAQGIRTTGLVIGALSGVQRVQSTAEILTDTIAQVQALTAHAQPGTSAGSISGVAAGGVLSGTYPDPDFAPLVDTADQGYFFGVSVLFPLAATPTAAFVAAGNQVRAVQFVLPFSATVGKVTIDVTTAQAGAVMDVGLYDAAGNIVCQTAGLSAAAIAQVQGALGGAPITIPAGVYYYAYTSSVSTVQARLLGLATPLVNTLLNFNTTKKMGTAANAATAGILPATLGAITAANISAVLALFER